jgi:hypothetical protein
MPDDIIGQGEELVHDVLAYRLADRATALVVLLRLHQMGYVTTETCLQVVERSLRSEG